LKVPEVKKSFDENSNSEKEDTSFVIESDGPASASPGDNILKEKIK
jgi:hypothetical protein